jgi:Zn-dependent protease
MTLPAAAVPPSTSATVACENCGRRCEPDTLVCPNCATLVYRRQLEQLAAEAMDLEAAAAPVRAAMAWRRCLDFLPPDSRPYDAIARRAGALAAGLPVPPIRGDDGQAYGAALRQPEAVKPPDSWPLALFKTVGSMLLSVACYMILWRSPNPTARLVFAAGFTALILVHELGHVIAMRRYRLSASPPIFIPFLGAVINMRQQPRDAWVEAVVGIGGPALGTVAGLAAVAVYAWGGFMPGTEYYELAHSLAYFGVMLNLFNLLPFPPLDGGRISAALSPWMWLIGVAGLGLLLYKGQIPVFMAALLIFAGLPRILDTLRDREARNDPYYRIPAWKSALIAVSYAGLAALLTGLLLWLGKPVMFG